MSQTDRLRKAPKAFRRLTGLTPFAFGELPEKLISLYGCTFREDVCVTPPG